MDNIKFPYRSDGHLALLHVVNDSGSWEKHGLQVDYDFFISAEDAHRGVAKGAGLKVIEIPFQPMIWFTTISTSWTFAQKHPDIVERVLKGVVEGIQFFKTQKAKAAAILETRYGPKGWDREIVEHVHAELAGILEKKPYPTLSAIRNVFELAKRQNPECAGMNPLAVWDMHYLRQIDDSGFIDRLYA